MIRRFLKKWNNSIQYTWKVVLDSSFDHVEIKTSGHEKFIEICVQWNGIHTAELISQVQQFELSLAKKPTKRLHRVILSLSRQAKIPDCIPQIVQGLKEFCQCIGEKFHRDIGLVIEVPLEDLPHTGIQVGRRKQPQRIWRSWCAERALHWICKDYWHYREQMTVAEWVEDFSQAFFEHQDLWGWIHCFTGMPGNSNAMTWVPTPQLRQRVSRSISFLQGFFLFMGMLAILLGLWGLHGARQVEMFPFEYLKKSPMHQVAELNVHLQHSAKVLKKIEQRLPWGFRAERQRKHQFKQLSAEAQNIRTAFSQNLIDAMESCSSADSNSSDCGVRLPFQFTIWKSMIHAQAPVDSITCVAWHILAQDSCALFNSWIQFVESEEAPSELCQRWQQVIQTHSNRDGLDPWIAKRMNLIPADSKVQSVLGSFQMDSIFEIAIDSTVPNITGYSKLYTEIFKKQHQRRLAQIRSTFWIQSIQKSPQYLTIDSSALVALLERIEKGYSLIFAELRDSVSKNQFWSHWKVNRSAYAETKIQEFWSQGLRWTWPFHCAPTAPDADSLEVYRLLRYGNPLDSLLPHLLNDSVRTWHRAMQDYLLDAQGQWKKHEVHWRACASPLWKIRIQMDTTDHTLMAGSGQCIEGELLWPEGARKILIQAEHGSNRVVKLYHGFWAIQRMVSELGQWSTGQGCEITMHLRSTPHLSKWKIWLEERGEHPRMLHPCGLALRT